MKNVARPAPVLMSTLRQYFNCVSDTPVRFGTRVSQKIESAQNVIVPEHREREAKPQLANNFSRLQRAQPVAIKQIVFCERAALVDPDWFLQLARTYRVFR